MLSPKIKKLVNSIPASMVIQLGSIIKQLRASLIAGSIVRFGSSRLKQPSKHNVLV